MTEAVQQNYEEQQAAFESLLSWNDVEAAERNEMSDRYDQALMQLASLINDYDELEEHEKAQLHEQVRSIIDRNICDLDQKLIDLSYEAQKLRGSLYMESISLVRSLEHELDSELDDVSDYWHIDDEEFNTEVSGQLKYMYTGILGLDTLTQINIKRGQKPKKALEKSIKKYLSTKRNLNLFKLKTLKEKLTQLGIKLRQSLAISYLEINSSENLRQLDHNLVRSAKKGEQFQIIKKLPNKDEFEYALVMDERGETFKICTNDGNRTTAKVFHLGPKSKISTHIAKRRERVSPVSDKDVEFKMSDFRETLLRKNKKNWEAFNLIPGDRREEALCSAYIIHYLDSLFGSDFIETVGLKKGNRFSDAWMMSKGMLESGYAKEVANLRECFAIDEDSKQIRIDTEHPKYKKLVDRFMKSAFNPHSNRGLMLFHYKKTESNSHIIKNLARDNKGDIDVNHGSNLNSHATLNLGLGTREFSPKKKGINVADAILMNIKDIIGEKGIGKAWKNNRFLLQYLKNVTIDNQLVTFDGKNFRFANKQLATIKDRKAKIKYDDLQLTDFYHYKGSKNEKGKDFPIARTIGLTEMMIQGRFEPVSVFRFDPKKVDILSNKTDVQAVGTFEKGHDINQSLARAYQDTFGKKLSHGEVEDYKKILMALNIGVEDNPIEKKDPIPLFDLDTVPWSEKMTYVMRGTWRQGKAYIKENVLARL